MAMILTITTLDNNTPSNPAPKYLLELSFQQPTYYRERMKLIDSLITWITNHHIPHTIVNNDVYYTTILLDSIEDAITIKLSW